MERSVIEEMLLPYDNYKLECDGFTKIATYLLTLNNIPHKILAGTLLRKIDHYWIETDKYIVDYRARIWGKYLNVTPDTLPHGVHKKPINGIYFNSRAIDLEVSKNLFQMLIATSNPEFPPRYTLSRIEETSTGE